MQTITKNLLTHVSDIRNKYDEFAALTGENFDIFSVLGMQHDEVRLHSRLIGELLNPKGKHNQGDLFLKLFLNQIELQNHNEDETQNASVIVEESVGNITNNYEAGGRIDLVIKFPNNKPIVIENKIWTGDQYKQLWRYKQQYPNAYLVYLTPFGNKASKESLHEINSEDVIYVSYKTDIKSWINDCIKEVSRLPLIREVLNHYLHTINQITNQSTNNKMSKEIIHTIIENGDNVKSAFAISSTIESVKKELLNVFIEKFIEYFNKKEYHDFNVKPAPYSKWGNVLVFKSTTLKNYSLHLYIQLGQVMLEGPYVHKDEKGVNHISQEDKKRFETLLSSVRLGKSKYFDNWVWIQEYDSFNTYYRNNDLWIDVANKNFDKINDFIKDIDKILELIKNTNDTV